MDAEGIWEVMSMGYTTFRNKTIHLRSCMSMLFNLLVVVLTLALDGCAKLFRISKFLPSRNLWLQYSDLLESTGNTY
jgi:hypothetical protein